MKEIGRYYGCEVIGRGAFGIVFKGKDKENNEEVAIKKIAKKNSSQKEIKIFQELKGLQHENLVSLLRCMESSSNVYLVMEYCNHGDLADYLFHRKTLNEVTIQHFFSQIAKALEALYSKAIVHRDLKPQNILLCNPRHPHIPLPTQLVVKLADFGLARSLPEGNMAETCCGSPRYMAPEVIMSHQYGAKADLWSTGTIIYQCLTGTAPFMAPTPQALKNIYERTTDLKPNIPDHCSPLLANLLLGLLKRNPADRMEFNVFFIHPFFTSDLSNVPLNGGSPADGGIAQRYSSTEVTHQRIPAAESNSHLELGRTQTLLDNEIEKNRKLSEELKSVQTRFEHEKIRYQEKIEERDVALEKREQEVFELIEGKQKLTVKLELLKAELVDERQHSQELAEQLTACQKQLQDERNKTASNEIALFEAESKMDELRTMLENYKNDINRLVGANCELEDRFHQELARANEEIESLRFISLGISLRDELSQIDANNIPMIPRFKKSDESRRDSGISMGMESTADDEVEQQLGLMSELMSVGTIPAENGEQGVHRRRPKRGKRWTRAAIGITITIGILGIIIIMLKAATIPG